MSHNCSNTIVGKISLLTGSYPPLIDGVANTAWNYAKYLKKNHEGSVVYVPRCWSMDYDQSTPGVFAYPSIDTTSWFGYPTAIPMAPSIARESMKNPPTLMHMLDPLSSAFIASEFQNYYHVPTILTYNTKYDQDLKDLVKSKMISKLAIKCLMRAALSSDEVWVVSRGAGDNLHALGYEGETILMPNGVDMPHKKASESVVMQYCGNLPKNVPILLFVGRMIKAKGILQIISALQILKAKNQDFRMVFIGNGRDFDLLKSQAKSARVDDCCLFLGGILNREILHAWYTRADLLVFPSEYDTQGLVVTEAAATGTPSLLIRGSDAAENVTDLVNGFLTQNTPQAIAETLLQLLSHPSLLKKVGENASRDLYLSWEDAVDMAYARYQIVLDKYKRGDYKRRHLPGDAIMKAQADFMFSVAKLFP